ncbi:MAG: glycosyltransferase family 4 protein [Prevotella sp.]|nr:glycosyltransferase family 4 protein [Prevotella sp.]
MRLAIDCRFIGKSGIGTYIENIVDELCNNHPEHKYLLITELGKDVNYDNDNVSILYTSIQPFSLREIFAFPTREINQCDAYFTPYINIPGRIRIPVFSTIHDVVFFDVDGLSSTIGNIFRKLVYRRAIRLSKVLFTVSYFSKKRILYHFPTDKQIEVLYNGVSKSCEQYAPQLPVIKQNYFIYVGNIKRHKGLHTLVDAFEKAQQKGLTSKLIIVGSNEKFRTSDNLLTSRIENNHNIEFTGWVTNERLFDLIAHAKALVQPSLYEGFGIPPLEALYLNTDVIMSDIPVFKELYSEIPDCFFEVGNIDDLAGKLLYFQPNPRISEIKSSIMKRYNYNQSASQIVEIILKKINQ